MAVARYAVIQDDPARGVSFREWLGLWFLALIPRLIFLFQLFGSDPLFNIPVGDAITYVKHALAFKSGIWLVHSHAFSKSPFYIYFLGTIFKLLGQNLIVVKLLQAGLDAFSCLLVFQITLRLFHNFRIGLTAFVLACLYAPLLVYTGQLLPTTWAVFFQLLLLWRLSDPDLKELTQKKLPVVRVGVLLGFLVVTRANFLLAVPLLTWWLTFRPGVEKAIKRKLRTAFLFLAGVGLVILPVTVRNYYVSGDLVLINDMGGINFLIGNDPGYAPYEGGWMAPSTWNRIFNTPFKLGIIKASDRTNFYYRTALKSFYDYPLIHVKGLAEKVRLFFSSYEIPNNCNIHRLRNHSGLLKILSPFWVFFYLPFGLVVSFFFIGCFYNPGSRATPLYLLWLAGFFTCVWFFNTSRYRLPAAVLMLIPAAAGMFLFYELLKRLLDPASYETDLPDNRGRVLIKKLLESPGITWGVMAIPLGAAILFNLTPPRDLHPYSEEYYLARQEIRHKNFPAALAHYQRNVERHPEKIRGYRSLGEFYLFKLKKFSQAEKIFKQIPERTDNPDWLSYSYMMLANIYRRQERKELMLEQLKKIVSLNPDRAFYEGKPYFQFEKTPTSDYFTRWLQEFSEMPSSKN